MIGYKLTNKEGACRDTAVIADVSGLEIEPPDVRVLFQRIANHSQDLETISD